MGPNADDIMEVIGLALIVLVILGVGIIIGTLWSLCQTFKDSNADDEQ